MRSFADRTGLTSDRPQARYLWTDAFAVCNFLELAHLTGERSYADLARQLVDQVHHELARYRADDARTGWTSGLGEREGEAHPTRGGLRIGKTLPERRPEEPLDQQLEWDRDGQYFHYLTKWMHALDQVSGATGDPRFNFWARELGEVTHAAFTRGGRAGRRMVWKMSTDLSRPLVASMGQHDPLDGLITCAQLETTAALWPRVVPGPDLRPAVADFATMVDGLDLGTEDPLGLGGLLSDACRVVQLMARGTFHDGILLERLLRAAYAGLVHCSQYGDWRQPPSRRLAFRELGLAGIERLQKNSDEGPLAFGSEKLHAQVHALDSYVGLRAAIAPSWLEPQQQRRSIGTSTT